MNYVRKVVLCAGGRSGGEFKSHNYLAESCQFGIKKALII